MIERNDPTSVMSRARPWEMSYPESLRDYVLDLSTMPAHPADLPADAFAAFGDRRAFTTVLPSGEEASLDFGQVDAMSNALANYLRNELGLAPGDVVGILLPNGLHYPLAVFGAWKAGLIITLINPLYTPREVDHQLTDSSAKVLIASDRFIASAQDLGLGHRIELIIARSFADFYRGNDTDRGVAAADPASLVGDLTTSDPGVRHDVVLYQYTGGTTGRSKAAVIDASNVLAALRTNEDFLEGFENMYRGGNTLTALPLYHIFAFILCFLTHFRAGSHNILIPSPKPMSNLRPAFEKYRIEWMSGVDTLYAGLLAEAWFRNDPPPLRFALTGGTASRPATTREWEDVVGPLVEGYGLTEATSVLACNPPTKARRNGTVGLPYPGCDVKVVDEGGSEVDLGQTGELLIRGPQVIQRYRAGSEENSAFVDGWFRTGDVGRIGDGGYIEIVDRKKDIILVSGFNVYPNEIEAVIADHPSVVEVAVIGVADEKTGEAVKAFIVSNRPGLEAHEIIIHCKANLAAYKMPKHIEFCASLPKSTVGKILRAQLRGA